jgi:predicted transcriptional regulator
MNKSIIIPSLMTLGLLEIEAVITLEVLDREITTISELAKKLHVSRTTLYKHIQKLLEKNILEKIPNSRSYRIHDKEHLKKRIQTNLTVAEEELSTILQNTTEYPEIDIIKGHNNLKDVYEAIGKDLKKGDVYYRYTSRMEDHKKSELYTELKKKKDIERLVITSEQKAGSKAHDPNRFIKTVPKDFAFDDDVSLVIYGNKIVHIDHKGGSAVTITSKKMARFQEKLFKLLWGKL